MPTTFPAPPASGAPEPPIRFDNLALIFQEVLTVIVRLRANRHRVGDPETFRAQIRNALKAAEQEALRRGYSDEETRVATFAVVAFLDESILNSQNHAFADWARRPLQLELFGVQIAGEIFFRNIERLLRQQDSQSLADLLEVHQLSLLLGFRGRYGATGVGEVRSLLAQIEEKIRRIKQPRTPPWQVKPQIVVPRHDPSLSILQWIALGSLALALLLFVIFKVTLSSSEGGFETIVAEVSR